MNPPDFRLIPVSRTIGGDRLVDEFIVQFTHTTEMDWMLPGVAPTGREVSVPTVAIVQFEEGKLVHEHIYWDQASVLVQIGKLDAKDLPVTGVEASRKVADKTLPSNALMGEALGTQHERLKTFSVNPPESAAFFKQDWCELCSKVRSKINLGAWQPAAKPSKPPRS